MKQTRYSSFLLHFGHLIGCSSSSILIPQRKQMQSLQAGQYQFAPVIRLPQSEHGLVGHSLDMMKRSVERIKG